MRHRRKGRVLGRSPSHRRALYRNMTSALFLTERDASLDDNAPKVPGRIITTLEKAKEIRPTVEKCITLAKKALVAKENAEQYATQAERGTDAYKEWRKSDQWRKWADARAPYVNAQRRAVQLMGDREAVSILFDTVAPRFADRSGGYTRIMRLAKPRLGDGGTRAILEFVGKNDKANRAAAKPSFESAPESASDEAAEETKPEAKPEAKEEAQAAT